MSERSSPQRYELKDNSCITAAVASRKQYFSSVAGLTGRVACSLNQAKGSQPEKAGFLFVFL